MQAPPVLQYHPLFTPLDADVILQSRDGVCFKVYSVVLRAASGFFRATLSLPQAPDPSGKNTTSIPSVEIIHLEEESGLVVNLMNVISGYGLSPTALSSFHDVTDLLFAAEKYEMTGVVAVVRLGMSAPRFLAKPLELYSLSRRFGWDDEAQLAGTLMLSLDITYPAYHDTLSTLRTHDLLALLKIRWTRQAALKQALDDGDQFCGSKDPYKCTRCGQNVVSLPWKEWKLVILSEFSRLPSGESILRDDFWCSNLADRVFAPFCKSPGCEGQGFDRNLTIQRIRDCIEGLPKSI